MKEQPQVSKKFNPRLRRLAFVLIIIVLIAGIIVTFLHDSSSDAPLENENTEQLSTEVPERANEEISQTSIEEDDNQTSSASTIEFRNQEFAAFVFDPAEHDLRLFHKDTKGAPFLRFDLVNNLLGEEDLEVVLLTNAGIFNEDYSPTGMLITPEQTYGALNTKDGNGNFYLKPNGVFYQLQNGQFKVEQTIDFDHSIENIQLATQSGPMLVINDSIHPAFNEGSSNLNIRNGVGINNRGQVVFAISQKEVNFYDFALLFRDELGCANALYLDGFISEMHLPELNREALNTARQFSGIFAITIKK